MDREARTTNRERGVRLRDSRVRAAMTQAELAEILSVADNTISSWERGVNAIPKSARITINRALGLPDHSSYIWDGVEISDVRLDDAGAWVIEGTFRLLVNRESRGTP